MDAIQTELIGLVVAVITAMLGVATKSVVSFMKKKGIIAQLENHKAIVKIVVNAVEQTFNELNGEEKFHMAKIQALELMKEKKINITEAELNALIESSVKEMKKSVNEIIEVDDNEDYR